MGRSKRTRPRRTLHLMLVFVQDDRVEQQHPVYPVYISDALVLPDERVQKQRQVHRVLLLVRAGYAGYAWCTSCPSVSRSSASRSSARYTWCTARIDTTINWPVAW